MKVCVLLLDLNYIMPDHTALSQKKKKKKKKETYLDDTTF